MKRISSLLIALLALFLALPWTGCLDTNPSGKSTAVYGRVVDPSGAPIFGVTVGAVFSYFQRSGAPSPGAVIPGAGPVTLDPPYPDPADNPEGKGVSIRIHASADTTVRVEVWGTVGGSLSRVASVFSGPASGTRTLGWDGSDDIGQHLPNGLYRVRLYVPAGASEPAAEQALLINRPAAVLFAEEAVSAFTDADGHYVLDDLPVGEPFTLTSSSGAVVSAAVVENAVTIHFQDPDYQPYSDFVRIGPGEQVDKTTTLQPNVPAAPLTD